MRPNRLDRAPVYVVDPAAARQFLMGMELENADDEIDCLMKTTHYFMGFVNFVMDSH